MPRYTSKDGQHTIETSNTREIMNLRRDGWREEVAKTKAVREEDSENPANVVPPVQAPKSSEDKKSDKK